ncbi:MAG: hypothetical protein H6754_02795 [Candidatus Omnitrophica bacterium]|nr:hypothetical protein [Candidatus Omnitrophota bacterium]
MIKAVPQITLLILFLAIPAFAQIPLQTITLKDGTSIKGQLSGVTGGFYTIDNATMGQIKIPAEQVISINASEATPASLTVSANEKLSGTAFNGLQSSMMLDPQIMNLIQEMIQDPSVAELLTDPVLMQDALTMDPQKIQSNPTVLKLMQNPKMQEILQATMQKMQASGATK